MTGRGNAQPELDEKQRIVRDLNTLAATASPSMQSRLAAIAEDVDRYLLAAAGPQTMVGASLAAGGTGERERQGSEDLHERSSQDVARSPGAPQGDEPATSANEVWAAMSEKQRSLARLEAIQRDIAHWIDHLTEHNGYDLHDIEPLPYEALHHLAVLASPSPVSPAGRASREQQIETALAWMPALHPDITQDRREIAAEIVDALDRLSPSGEGEERTVYDCAFSRARYAEPCDECPSLDSHERGVGRGDEPGGSPSG